MSAVLVVVQARVGSSRLPGKVLLPLCGAPMLERQIERLLAAQSRFELVVATSWHGADDPIAALCRRLAIGCFRGHPTDLLDRHYQAARQARADVVVKVPSDCPLVDPRAVDLVLERLAAAGRTLDYVSNLHPPSWPDGNDVEALPFDVLETAWREARQPHEREHTTPFVWDQPDRFRIANVGFYGNGDLSLSHRLTVDYPEDHALVAAIYAALYDPRRTFSLEDVLALLHQRPELLAINARLQGVNWYRHHLGTLRTIGAEATREPEPVA